MHLGDTNNPLLQLPNGFNGFTVHVHCDAARQPLSQILRNAGVIPPAYGFIDIQHNEEARARVYAL
jgi:hypothetical protein